MKAPQLTKLKSALKKLPSFTNCATNSPTSTAVDAAAAAALPELHTVYVGKSRRQYLVSSEVMKHPLFQEMVDKSNNSSHDATVLVACEVVMFDHLLWMIHNSADSHLDSMDELVQFYSY